MIYVALEINAMGAILGSDIQARLLFNIAVKESHRTQRGLSRILLNMKSMGMEGQTFQRILNYYEQREVC